MSLVESTYEFDTVGFTVIRNVLESNFVKNLRERLLAATEAQNESYCGERHQNDQWMVHNLMFADQSFLDLLDNKAMLEMLDYALGDTSLIYAYQSSSMPANGTNYSNRVHVDCPRWIENHNTNVGIIFPLNDFNAQSGGTYFLPGSHKSPLMPSEEYFYAKATQVECKSGDLVFFNARTVHSGGENLTNEPRAAITINCCRSYMRQRFNFAEMGGDQFGEGLNEAQRRLLGYNVRMPKSLGEFYLPEEKRLYKANQG
jgi:ectoine hydroxylase-related dioxygenase (phytanoyl-CoA dioxygenase family)